MKNSFTLYNNCGLCPRKCLIDRNINKGFCGERSELRIDSALLHFGEEPPISFNNGSGTIFFNGCSLRCVFCQNMQISQGNIHNKKYSLDEFVKLMEELIAKGAENINFVTPDHFLPHIKEGVTILKKKGYNIPIVYNSSGYHTIEHLEQTLSLVDIYLFDYKYADKTAAKRYSNAIDYPETAFNGLKFIYKNKGNLLLNKDGKAEKGILIRHLVLPGNIDNSIAVLDNIFFELGPKTYLSLMSQYSPKYLKEDCPEINRPLYKEEYDKVLKHLNNLGFKNCFIQDLPENKDRYTPDFNEKKMFERW